jgi:hypothetical protein
MQSKCQRYRERPHTFPNTALRHPNLYICRSLGEHPANKMASKIGRSIACSLGKPLANRTASLAIRRGHVAAVCSLSVCSKLKSPPLWRYHNVVLKKRDTWERSFGNSPSDEAEILDAYSNAIISVSFASQPHYSISTRLSFGYITLIPRDGKRFGNVCATHLISAACHVVVSPFKPLCTHTGGGQSGVLGSGYWSAIRKG